MSAVSRSDRPFRPACAGHLLVALLAWAWTVAAFGQPLSNLRQRWIRPGADTLLLDTISIVPGSLRILANGRELAPGSYSLDPFRARLLLQDGPDSVLARYRVLALDLSRPVQHKDPAALTTPGNDRIDPFTYEPPRGTEDLLGMRGLQRSGSISRGVLFGNNQDLSVNSSLNLEMSGRLSDRIGVLASVTDNNIPIQAGGNTAELQDFDQVFIKLFEEGTPGQANAWELVAGDFVLQRPSSHFMTYMKKNKGLSFEGRTDLGGSGRGRSGVSVAISKGKFARNSIQGQEGVQGPYRLRGDAGELFIIVLSGTERVYIDGQLMDRGQENDYIIDYNTAEVTFTSKRLITKDRRITVEFQYSDKNYARSLVRANSSQVFGRSAFHFNLFSEQDHRNQPLQQQLNEAEREVLRLAGDDPFAATVSGVDSTGFIADQVLYRPVDSLGYAPVYVYSTAPDSAFLRITFSPVGAGNGDYVQQDFTPNGRVFRWVAPDTVNGVLVRRGDHAPLRVLIAPRSQQMMTLGFEHKAGQRTRIRSELSYTNLDRNTFSNADRNDDQGAGLMAAVEHAIPISAKDSTLQLTLSGDLEAVTSDFRAVERYRSVEFERNWNVQGRTLVGDQVLANALVGIRGARLGRLRAGLGGFRAGDAQDGLLQQVHSDVHWRRTDLVGQASRLVTRGVLNSDFLRHKGQFRQRFKHFTLGYQDEHELNRFRADSTDALLTGSYQFHEWEAFVQSPDTQATRWRLAGGQRTDRALRDGGLQAAAQATSYSADLGLGRDPRNRVATRFTYRRLEILDSTLTSQRPENTYLARVDYDANIGKGFAVVDLFYEFGSGLELRREYIYVEVPAGQGLYIWNDYNGDGVKDLNEFELANFSYEANYLRVFVPSNNYVRTFSNQLSASLDLRPGARWLDREGVRGFLARFSDLASYRSDLRSTTDDLLLAMTPVAADLLDTNLTAYTSSARNNLYFDRTSRTWSVDHAWQRDQSRSLLLNGFESRSREFNTLHGRWNTTRHWTIEVELEQGRVTNSSDLLSGRSFAIDQQGMKPKLTWQPNTSFRAVGSFKYVEKKNRPEFGTGSTEAQDLGVELRYNTVGKGSVLANANLVDIRFEGQENTPLGNELLNGLRPGTNYTWSLAVQRNLGNNLQVDITYNGRKSEGLPVVHVGGAQVRAFF
jgi:hypothetical protein